ncbi:MAG: GatB/YqeY domain-containing protein [Candidatus Jettenia sp.]|uniref:GatB/YqeY domain-containing protein n=1 Tax=Candidatus Jettenia caeni TaxID=247490 RepID=I3IQM5_9BACT|nr:GatB/YqeY domain-containing protein [Candidatus Jettenia sp. AMX1]MBC6929915.1 GatB/YqeY domain-containing protein [Candidatus Jettenia sp.]NUN22971.1 GatB/YqeY domain-containing protein [Candidatus Jettenia caeni]KAA0248526.1 MAG: GatB/YqeY domain-containing protein [Candidatus Jettenia sp. AMX1]MCE7881848.1 GatB/YqeY domain-containing protein [Candidatus Jettenia sp. AMX1]MCQ3928197.1 GatB/YqeY domain-containing protein [Candidatus Jettenia sp.]
MNLKDRITEDLKTAMKAQDKLRTSVLRMMLADVKIADTSGKPKDQIDYTEVVRGYYKKLKKTCEEYERLHLPEKVKELDREIAIVEEYLPEQLSDDEIKKIVSEVIESNKFTAKEMGAAMKLIMSKHGSVLDGKKVQMYLREKLGS